jgi:DNA-binding MurR/RpiR family transcriptional regulator
MDALVSSAAQIAAAVGTSDATVVRTARALGYGGLPDLKRWLGVELTREVDPVVRFEESMQSPAIRAAGPIGSVLASAEAAHEQLSFSITREILAGATAIMAASSHVYSWGLGISGTAAGYATERLGRSGVVISTLDQSGFNLANRLITVRQGSSVLLFVPGRAHPDLLLLLKIANDKGIPSILVSNSLGADIRVQASHVIDLPESNSKVTTETLPQILLVDMLAQQFSAENPVLAKRAHEELRDYRRFGMEGI